MKCLQFKEVGYMDKLYFLSHIHYGEDPGIFILLLLKEKCTTGKGQIVV